MQVKLLCLAISLLCLQTVKAENPDTLIAYWKNSGKQVTTRDSADYYRVLLPPDSNIDKELYRVYDYYANGKLKLVATSFTNDINHLTLDGASIIFFPNGKRKTSLQFKNGIPYGIATNYYPNGNLYSIIKVEVLRNQNSLYSPYTILTYKSQIIELRDSTGKVLVAKGTGHVMFFDEDFKSILEEGNISDNKREGEWKGSIADSGKYVCFFHKDEIKSGISYMKSGNHYTFNKIQTSAEFSDGQAEFLPFIKKNLQYPEYAKKRGITGTVWVEFWVEINGTVSNVKVRRGLIKSLDEEAVRVISLSPLWMPASKFGIPYRTYHTMPVDFDNL